MDNNEKKVDRRVIKTKKAIKNALAELLTKKNINDITITDIALTADINRKTFYKHYSDARQIIDEIENDIVHSFEVAIENVDIESNFGNPYPIFYNITSIISADKDFYKHILKMDDNSRLFDKIVYSAKKELKVQLSKKLDTTDDKLDIIVDYTVSGMIAVCKSWFDEQYKMPLDEVSHNVGTITLKGIDGLLGVSDS